MVFCKRRFEKLGIHFYKLFDLLNRRSIKKTELMKMADISSPTMAKLSKNETVSLEVINKICKALDCQPGDILEYIADESL
jgi:putative transcriptional regulator